jgi:Lactonase, 7-bladed beta-propeller
MPTIKPSLVRSRATVCPHGSVRAGCSSSKPARSSSLPAAAPNAFEGTNSVILTPDHRFLFATNGGDNSVSSFAVNVDGKLSLLDAKRTGNVVARRSGTARALAYSPSYKMLYVLHSFGPDHLRLMSVDDNGMLSARSEGYTVNTPDKPSRIATMASLTANENFLVVGTTLDEPAAANPDGSPIMWVQRNGVPHSIASNTPDPDGLIVSRSAPTGRSGRPNFKTAAAALRGTCSFCTTGPNTSSWSIPSATAWRLCPKVRGDGTFRALNGTVSAGASDNWICPAGSFYYQLYPNASKLTGYAIHPTGRWRRSPLRASPTRARRA